MALAACTPDAHLEASTPTLLSRLIPYHTPTPTTTPTLGQLTRSSPTPLPSPTPTPFTYRVVQGDTMLGIALRHGISLEDLMYANPEVNPRFLSIGTDLIIPIGDEDQGSAPLPTPLPLPIGAPTCYGIADGGAGCFLKIANVFDYGLENLSARILLYSIEGEFIDDRLTIAPINLLPPGETLPLYAVFSPPLLGSFTAEAVLVSALPVQPDNERYLDLRVLVDQEDISEDGTSAALSGRLRLIGESQPASLVWLIATAYDAEDNVVGFRKWEAYAETIELPEVEARLGEGLESGEDFPFEITVFSLGPRIERIEVLGEARP